MSAFTNWYSNQYQIRTARIQQTPYLARVNTAASRTATAMATAQTNETPNKEKENKKQESLFGPNIGVVNTGPAWTSINAKKVVADELTPDVVKSWIEKSKEPNHTTTTLQALINLKRPTIRLSPLTQHTEESSQDLQALHHGLEFEYDCDAPKCGIHVHALVHPDHPEATKGFAPALTSLLVYESVTPGGFDKTLKIEDGATLDLARYEYTQHPPSTAVAEPSQEKELAEPDEGARHRKRFTMFKKKQTHSVSGPALAVVDAEPSQETKDVDEDVGVKVTIKLVALDEQGTELVSPNEQVTYLHVVRFGAAPTLEAGEDDPRPWVVKVVKREATIGPHTFHLHEIYGLSSSSSTNAAPTAPLPAHTYPPAEGDTELTPATEEEPSSECLVCLSSPREVVLLPCRHLVACKECALNMVEFGAGGNITHTEEPAEPAPAAVPATEGQAETGTSAATETPAATTTTTTPTPTPAAPRRKRKAKGWFCPVCRQPYTSLLRITTSPPPEVSKESSADPLGASSTPVVPASPPPAATPRLGSFRPVFLRSFSRNPPTPDLERGQVTPTAHA